MRFALFALFSSLLTVVSAHFHLQYPEPRGVFVADLEPTFCDGYMTAASNRSQFPLNGGIITITTSHPTFTFGVLLSTAQNPTSFDNFTQAVNYFEVSDQSTLCLPVNLAGIGSVTDGANVTLQMVFDGGDDKLYQCADVTLSNSFTVPSNVSCTNSTATSASSGTSASSSSISPAGSSSGAVSAKSFISVTGLMSVVGAMLAIL